MARDYRINLRIRAQSVRVIDEDGSQLGVMTLQEALTKAREREVDLVEVAPGAEPPVCRLLDYGRFRYLQTKKEKEARRAQKSIELREVRMRPAIGQHDLEAKHRTILKLLGSGAKVKITVMFRGRAITHPELGVALLRKIAESLQDDAKLEKAPSMEGRFLSIIMTPTRPKVAKAPATKVADPVAEAQVLPTAAATATVQGSTSA